MIASIKINKSFHFENFYLSSTVDKYKPLKNIIAVKNLVQFYERHPDSKSSIETWIAIVKNADWQKSLDVVKDSPDADPVKNTEWFLISQEKNIA